MTFVRIHFNHDDSSLYFLLFSSTDFQKENQSTNTKQKVIEKM